MVLIVKGQRTEDNGPRAGDQGEQLSLLQGPSDRRTPEPGTKLTSATAMIRMAIMK